MLDAGTDTSAAYLQSLILLLCAFPNVTKVAQGALDSVVGNARLPILDDLKDLPYITAIIKEVVCCIVPHAHMTDVSTLGNQV